MEFREKAKIMDRKAMERVLMRIAHEIVEKTKGTKDLAIIGIHAASKLIFTTSAAIQMPYLVLLQ